MSENKNRRGKNICFCICLFVVTLSFGSVCYAKEKENDFDKELYAKAAVLMDGTSQRVLYGKNEREPLAMASTTKIMTCITILEQADLNENLTVSSYAASMPKVKLYLKKGENYRVEDLLYSLMLESHNDSAVALAEHVGKKYVDELREKEEKEFTVSESHQAVAAFAKLMNDKAKQLGCSDTYFITPNGLDATEEKTDINGEVLIKKHQTTARDLAIIMSYCIERAEKKEEFLRITSERTHSFFANARSFTCQNHNLFLDMMPGALSGKTGFTNQAGYCYVGALKQNGKLFIVTLLACGWPNNKGYKWKDTKALMEYGLSHFFLQNVRADEILIGNEQLPTVVVKEGQTKDIGQKFILRPRIALRDKGVKEENVLIREDEKITKKIFIKKEIQAPVESDEILGKVEYYLDDQVYMTENIVAGSNIGKIDCKWCLEKVFGIYLMGKKYL